MTKKITFRMHAYSDAAGKYDPEATLCGNEDNFYVDDNICDNLPSQCESDVVKELCDLGLIMAVADGMGGMNAGEIASGIAVQTVQEFFSPNKITPEIAKNHDSRKKYLEKLIVEADSRIKDDARRNPEHEGMGSTIIIAWIINGEMTLSWCGDSRAYRFNPASGIELISEDHSYVQELVQKGLLTYEQTFEHPQGNIITRSLGDESKKAQPETRFFDVYNNDIILLCSDGLSGVLRDKKTPDGEGGYFPGDNIEDIIRDNCNSLVQCREALWRAAENAGWYDNVTAILCEITSGATTISVCDNESAEDKVNVTNNPNLKPWWTKSVIKLSPKNISYILIAIIIIIAICFGGYKGWIAFKNRSIDNPSDSDKIDTLLTNQYVEKDTVTNKEQVDTLNTPAPEPSKGDQKHESVQRDTSMKKDKDGKFEKLKRKLEKGQNSSEETELSEVKGESIESGVSTAQEVKSNDSDTLPKIQGDNN